jgi:membrane protein insertase Oxa1/YidC/SpoIIIJ
MLLALHHHLRLLPKLGIFAAPKDDAGEFIVLFTALRLLLYQITYKFCSSDQKWKDLQYEMTANKK